MFDARAHAIVEQVCADVTDGPLAHLPSVISFPSNAAWLTCAAIACNLLRAVGALPASPTPEPAAPPCAAT